ncbi:VOC family protein [Micromonospora sp. NPDC049275]|uniref:VOC family protein n=1 Tax=Micromonospora sp. NPDC049275 TaxID=3364268 RepID=UPI00371A3A4E
MACRIGEIVLKCRDPEVLARFWCEVLDFVELDREEAVYIKIGPREGFGGPQPTIFLIRDDGPKNGYARLHIDVNPPTAIRTPSSRASWRSGLSVRRPVVFALVHARPSPQPRNAD